MAVVCARAWLLCVRVHGCCVCVHGCCVRACMQGSDEPGNMAFFLQTQGNSGRLRENVEYFLKIRENSKLPCVMLGNGDTTLRTGGGVGGGGGAQKWTNPWTGRGGQNWLKMCGRPL